MDSQLVDLGSLLAVVGILWGAIASSTKGLNRRLDKQDELMNRRLDKQDELMNRRLDKQDGVLAGMDTRLTRVENSQIELKAGQAGLKEAVAGLREGVAGLREGQASMGGNIIQIVADLGEVRGELKRIAPREKVTAGGS